MSHNYILKQIGNIDLVKQLNSAVVYRIIDQNDPISRIHISEQSQLAPASVTKITRQLLERGLIKEVAQQASTGGRRPISIISEHHIFHSIGVRLSRRDYTLVLYALNGKMLAEAHSPLPLPETGQQEIENHLIAAIENFIQQHQRPNRELIAISVILPSLVNPQAGIVHCMPHIKVHNWQLLRNLKEHFKITCFIGHDIRSFALAEHYFGATQNCADSIFVRIHHGAGAGVVMGGEILLDNRYNLGEIGHIQIDPLGERCHCGNFGCLETVAANSAIENRIRQQLEQNYPSQLKSNNCSIKAIYQAANKNDPLAIEAIKHVGHHLGKAIAIIINLFNPQKVVIAGEITAAEKVLLPAVQNCIKTQALKDFHNDLPIVTSQLAHNSAIGAFALTKRAM